MLLILSSNSRWAGKGTMALVPCGAALAADSAGDGAGRVLT